MGASSVSAVRRDSKSPDALSTLPVGRYVVGRSGPMRLSPFPPRTARSCLKLWHRRARAPIGWAAPVSTSRPLCLRLFPPRFGSPLLGRSPPLARLPSQVPGTGPLAPGGLAYEKPPDPAGYGTTYHPGHICFSYSARATIHSCSIVAHSSGVVSRFIDRPR